MKDKRRAGIVAAVTLTIATAFFAIAVLVLYESLTIACRYAESATALYASEVIAELPEGVVAVEGMDAVCFRQDGTVTHTTSKEVHKGDDVFQRCPTIAELRDQLNGEHTQILRLWTGINRLLPHNQKLYEIRFVRNINGYLLIINPAQAAFDEMRTRDTAILLALSVVMILLLLLVMGIVRWYRTQLIRVATTDELTGLANRKSFVASYEHRAEDGALREATLALIDVDRFKQINDTFGHAAGDLALASVAAELRRAVGSQGLTGRWGGDEFIGVFMCAPTEALARIESMIESIAGTEPVEGMHVSVSVGSTQVDDELALQQVVEQADDALYVTKEGGRGFLTIYEPGVTPHMTHDGTTATPQRPRRHRETRPLQATLPRTASSKSDTLPHQRAFMDLLVRSLLEAVYRMVPFVAGGGILIAVAFIIDGASVDLNSLSATARANFGSITPLASGLRDVGSAAFNFMLPIFAAFFAQKLAGDEAFMAGFAGGYLASQGSAGFLGAICAAMVAALVVYLMRGVINDSALTIRRIAPVLLYPVFSLLIMYLLMMLLIDPAASAFDAWLTTLLHGIENGSHTVLGAVCGAMMATDMGGPINKAAYHFGTASIAAGSPDIMAAVMVGGMVPPCGIALSMLAFRRRFSDAERDQLAATLFMGLSFITEGAIPFVITDIIRVIPSCMVGSAVAGALSAGFGCTLVAPHGGIFVLPVIGNAPAFCVALLSGSIVTALALGLLKRKRHEARDPNATDIPSAS